MGCWYLNYLLKERLWARLRNNKMAQDNSAWMKACLQRRRPDLFSYGWIHLVLSATSHTSCLHWWLCNDLAVVCHSVLCKGSQNWTHSSRFDNFFCGGECLLDGHGSHLASLKWRQVELMSAQIHFGLSWIPLRVFLFPPLHECR